MLHLIIGGTCRGHQFLRILIHLRFVGKDFSLSDLLLKLQFVKLFIFAHFPGLLLIEEGREGLLLGSPFDVLL